MSFNNFILVPGFIFIAIMITYFVGMNNFITECEDKKGYLMFIDKRLSCVIKTPKVF